MRKTLVFYRGRALKVVKPIGSCTSFISKVYFFTTLVIISRVFHKNNNIADRDDNTSCSDETTTTSMESNYINFDYDNIIKQHVSCFSNLSHNQINGNQSSLVSKNSNSLYNASSDQMVLRTLLNQLTKNVEKSQSYREGSSSESHLRTLASQATYGITDHG
ncbi:NAC domain-containing protein 21/22 isoform X1 [Capsella rubella]|uniref:NAC domain-containing protein 21/22 isoform X1 n=1 Tax=Capsella rubella TaxID=81985 RepID=UPI000CD55B09|nr:NAC domain-containing protein 21/22 isoform X1 [Capsella rubella]